MIPNNLFPPKSSTTVFLDELFANVNVLQKNPRIEKILVVVDPQYVDRLGGNALDMQRCTFVAPADVTDEFLKGFDRDRSHVLYSVECNSDGLPAIEKIVGGGFKFSPFGGAPVGSYAYENRAARTTVERQFVYQHLGGYAKFGDPGAVDDFLNLCQALENTRNIPGAVVEIGCYKGSSSSVMLDYAKNAAIDRKFYFFDTFDGFSYPEARTSSDVIWRGSHATEGQAIVQGRLESIGYPDITVRRANIIADELPTEITEIAVANVDVDLYEAVLAGLNKVAVKMAVGGIIVCEDAGHTPALIGARLALKEFMEGPFGKHFVSVFLPSGQVFLVAVQAMAKAA